MTNPAVTPELQERVDRLIARRVLELHEKALGGDVARKFSQAAITVLSRDVLTTIAGHLHSAGYRKAAAAIRRGLEEHPR